ncbi:hypothetical protein PDESU_02847 [Pontiella desulfatans]|uniref:DUF3187 family protein n=1 Tax=Pontiella desulfatans TaxID=2750659 RepID=A0A6C2U2R4_PONDE|nr:DUF3187 family protein [Pontiella desulfatans]VGO14288.1 hypothetical protein PDESU_02847 [Pontiella desulfatans]
MKLKIKFLETWAVASLIGAGAALAVERTDPVYVANQNPFVQIYGLPKSEAGTITPKGKLDAAFLYYVSNNAFSEEADNGETFIWDGETAQYCLKLRYGVSERLELGIDLPYIVHSGGYLDSTIRKFHQLFGYSNDRQMEFEKNQIHYQIGENGDTLFEMTDTHSGLGDIRLTAAVSLLPGSIGARRHLAARSVLKLPTGNSSDLLGSGGTDVSAGLAYTDYDLLQSINTVVSANLGLLYMGDSEVLGDKQRNFAGYGGASLGWRALTWLDMKLQVDLHSAMYDTELLQLGHSLQLLAGGTVHLPGDVLMDLGISEQLSTDATPDVGFYLMVGHRF